MPTKQLTLPYSIVTRTDVGRLLRELQALESTSKRSQTKQSDDNPPPTSRLLAELADQNELNLTAATDRQTLKLFLETVQAKAPLLHFSFSTDPTPRFTARLVAWLRQEIDPLVLLQIGLEPALGAGCTLRTTNRFFNFSLRERLESQSELLRTQLHGDKS